MKRLIALIFIICIGCFFIGCGKQQTSNAGSENVSQSNESSSSRINSQEFIKFMEKSDFKITTSKQDLKGVLLGDFITLNVNGDYIGIYEYKSSQEMEIDAKTIRSDGSMIGKTIYDWYSEPHFYKGGDIIIIYIGANKDIMKKIEKLMGKQFAGLK